MGKMVRDSKSKSIKGMEWDEKETASDCAVILVVLVGKFSVWTESDKAGLKPPGWIFEIKVPRLLLSHHIPYHQGGIHLLTQKDGATESAGENRQKVESESLSGGFVGIESSWTLWGPVVRHRVDIPKGDAQQRIYCMYIDLCESVFFSLFPAGFALQAYRGAQKPTPMEVMKSQATRLVDNSSAQMVAPPKMEIPSVEGRRQGARPHKLKPRDMNILTPSGF